MFATGNYRRDAGTHYTATTGTYLTAITGILYSATAGTITPLSSEKDSMRKYIGFLSFSQNRINSIP